MPRLVASPLPGGALAVVHEPKEPVRGRHGGGLTAGGCSTSSWGDAPSVPEVPSGARRRYAPNTAPTTTRAARDRRVGARLSRAPDVAGCVAIPSYSPADSESAGFYASPPTSRTHYSAANCARAIGALSEPMPTL